MKICPVSNVDICGLKTNNKFMFANISFILYFFLPAMAANLAPVLADYYNFLPALNKPMDKGFKFRDRRILGDHKTVRGVVVGVVAGGIFGLLQGSVLLGLGMGLGAMWGDTFKSLIKRRFNIKPGTGWVPWDQVDFVIGASIVTFPIFPQPLVSYLVAIVVIGAGSFLISYIGVRMGIKRVY